MADTATDFLNLSADIVSAYVSNNSVPPTELPGLLRQVHAAVLAAATGTAAKPEAPAKPENLVPAVPIKRSVSDDHIVCLEDGLRFKSLKRHLRAKYQLSPEQYRAKWGLPPDYPMVAPNYAKARSDLAKAIGLGRPSRPADAPSTASGAEGTVSELPASRGRKSADSQGDAPVRAAARSARRDPSTRVA